MADAPKKFRAERHPLMLEAGLKQIVPTQKFVSAKMDDFFAFSFNNAPNKHAKSAIADSWIKEKVEQQKGAINKEWVDDFRAWVMGNSKFNTPECMTPWGRQPLIDSPGGCGVSGVKEWLSEELRMHWDFKTKLLNLYRNGPGENLTQAYLYYKYIVRAQDWQKQAQAARDAGGDAPSYPPWFDRSGQIDFLDQYGNCPLDDATDHPAAQVQASNRDGTLRTVETEPSSVMNKRKGTAELLKAFRSMNIDPAVDPAGAAEAVERARELLEELEEQRAAIADQQAAIQADRVALQEYQEQTLRELREAREAADADMQDQAAQFRERAEQLRKEREEAEKRRMDDYIARLANMPDFQLGDDPFANDADVIAVREAEEAEIRRQQEEFEAYQAQQKVIADDLRRREAAEAARLEAERQEQRRLEAERDLARLAEIEREAENTRRLADEAAQREDMARAEAKRLEDEAAAVAAAARNQREIDAAADAAIAAAREAQQKSADRRAAAERARAAAATYNANVAPRTLFGDPAATIQQALLGGTTNPAALTTQQTALSTLATTDPGAAATMTQIAIQPKALTPELSDRYKAYASRIVDIRARAYAATRDETYATTFLTNPPDSKMANTYLSQAKAIGAAGQKDIKYRYLTQDQYVQARTTIEAEIERNQNASGVAYSQVMKLKATLAQQRKDGASNTAIIQTQSKLQDAEKTAKYYESIGANSIQTIKRLENYYKFDSEIMALEGERLALSDALKTYDPANVSPLENLDWGFDSSSDEDTLVDVDDDSDADDDDVDLASIPLTQLAADLDQQIADTQNEAHQEALEIVADQTGNILGAGVASTTETSTSVAPASLPRSATSTNLSSMLVQLQTNLSKAQSDLNAASEPGVPEQDVTAAFEGWKTAATAIPEFHNNLVTASKALAVLPNSSSLEKLNNMQHILQGTHLAEPSTTTTTTTSAEPDALTQANSAADWEGLDLNHFKPKISEVTLALYIAKNKDRIIATYENPILNQVPAAGTDAVLTTNLKNFFYDLGFAKSNAATKRNLLNASQHLAHQLIVIANFREITGGNARTVSDVFEACKTNKSIPPNQAATVIGLITSISKMVDNSYSGKSQDVYLNSIMRAAWEMVYNNGSPSNYLVQNATPAEKRGRVTEWTNASLTKAYMKVTTNVRPVYVVK